MITNNIGALLTPIALAYLICDDEILNKVERFVTLCTNSFSLLKVQLLITALNDNFDLKCYSIKCNSNHRIVIPAYSIPKLRLLVGGIVPPMMQYKLGLYFSA